MDLLWFVFVGLVAGWLASKLMKGGGYGLVGDIVVGILGAVIGGHLLRFAGLSFGGGTFGSIGVATIGAVVLIYVARLVRRV